MTWVRSGGKKYEQHNGSWWQWISEQRPGRSLSGGERNYRKEFWFIVLGSRVHVATSSSDRSFLLAFNYLWIACSMSTDGGLGEPRGCFCIDFCSLLACRPSQQSLASFRPLLTFFSPFLDDKSHKTAKPDRPFQANTRHDSLEQKNPDGNFGSDRFWINWAAIERRRTPQNLINSAIALVCVEEERVRNSAEVVTLKLLHRSNSDDKLGRDFFLGRWTSGRPGRASRASKSFFLST